MNPEYLGMTASCIILLAGCMQSEKKLRIVDICGSILMATYGLIIHSLSVTFLNTALTAAHIYRLFRIKEEERSYYAERRQSEQPKEP